MEHGRKIVSLSKEILSYTLIILKYKKIIISTQSCTNKSIYFLYF